MKTVIATPLYPPDSGGPATYAKLLVEHLPAAHSTEPVGGVVGQRDEVALVKFSDVRHLPKGIRHARYFWNVLKVAQNADVILALDPVSVGLPAALAAGILRKPFVVKIVGDFAWEQGTQRFGVIAQLDDFVRQERVPFAVACLRVTQTFVARRAKRIIVPSEYLKGIITAWGIDPKKINVIYNSIQLPEAITEPSDKNTSKRSVISVGRLVPWKGMDGVIEAVAHIQQFQGETLKSGSLPAVTLTIVDDGPDKERLMKKGAELLGDSITFSGRLSHDEVLQAIQSSEIFVLNSSYEGLSHLLIEALMLGSAIIASDAGGNPEVIQNERTGLLVPVGDTKALTAAIERLLTDHELAARLRAAAKESASRFTVPAMIEKTHALLMSTTSSDEFQGETLNFKVSP
jgi:glycosyltransferase involved in cell wall biosynthesis